MTINGIARFAVNASVTRCRNSCTCAALMSAPVGAEIVIQDVGL
jgi:hypothetical protein